LTGARNAVSSCRHFSTPTILLAVTMIIIGLIHGRIVAWGFDSSDLVHATAVRDAIMHARTFLDGARHASNASIESTIADA
jgi:hypothetical protein